MTSLSSPKATADISLVDTDEMEAVDPNRSEGAASVGGSGGVGEPDRAKGATGRPGGLLALIGARANLVLVVGAAIAVVGVFIQWRSGEDLPVPPRVEDAQTITADEFVAFTGAELLFITESAGGGMLDVRYRVVDPDMALVFHDEALPIALYEPGGVYLERPFHEHSHDVELTPAAVYNELIVNTGSAFHKGDVVSLLVGPYRLDDVPIE